MEHSDGVMVVTWSARRYAVAVRPSVTVSQESMTRLSLVASTVTQCCGADFPDHHVTRDCSNLVSSQPDLIDCSDQNTLSDIARFTVAHKIYLI